MATTAPIRPTTGLTVVPPRAARLRSWLAPLVAVALGVLAAMATTWFIVATQTLQMSL